MFTGIVEETGTVAAVTPRGGIVHLRIACAEVSSGVREGDSVAVNGVCLTVTEVSPGLFFSCDAVRETLERTTLPAWRAGKRVNLERALTPSTSMGGHIVQGHVDGTAVLLQKRESPGGTELRFSADGEYARYLVPKGSVCIDGVSLTVAGLVEGWFRVALVPYTLRHTTLGELREGERVNVETDVIARYVERFLVCYRGEEEEEKKDLTTEFLRKRGFGRNR